MKSWLLISAIVALFLVGCTGTNDAPASPTNNPTNNPTPNATTVSTKYKDTILNIKFLYDSAQLGGTSDGSAGSISVEQADEIASLEVEKLKNFAAVNKAFKKVNLEICMKETLNENSVEFSDASQAENCVNLVYVSCHGTTSGLHFSRNKFSMTYETFIDKLSKNTKENPVIIMLNCCYSESLSYHLKPTMAAITDTKTSSVTVPGNSNEFWEAVSGLWGWVYQIYSVIKTNENVKLVDSNNNGVVTVEEFYNDIHEKLRGDSVKYPMQTLPGLYGDKDLPLIAY